jgi:hypothetical protein
VNSAANHRIAHEAHAEKQKAEPQQCEAELPNGGTAGNQAQTKAGKDDQIAVTVDIEGNDLHRQRRSQIGTKGYAEGRNQIHEARIGKPDHHDGCGTAMDKKAQKNAHAEAGPAVSGEHAQDHPQAMTCRLLKLSAHKFHAEDEEPDSSQALGNREDKFGSAQGSLSSPLDALSVIVAEEIVNSDSKKLRECEAGKRGHCREEKRPARGICMHADRQGWGNSDNLWSIVRTFELWRPAG